MAGADKSHRIYGGLVIIVLMTASCGGRTLPSEPPDSVGEAPEAGEQDDATETFIVTIGEPHTSNSGITVLVEERAHDESSETDGLPAVVSGESGENASTTGEYVPEDVQPPIKVEFRTYDISLTRGELVATFEYRWEPSHMYWYVEGVAHDHVFVMEPRSAFGDPEDMPPSAVGIAKDPRRRVTLIPSTTEPLEYEQVRDTGSAMGTSVADSVGCEGTITGGAVPSPGTYQHSVLTDSGETDLVCRILVGVYTGTAFVTMGEENWVVDALDP